MTRQYYSQSRSTASGIHSLCQRRHKAASCFFGPLHLTLVSMVVCWFSLRSARCAMPTIDIYGVSNRELQQESLRLGRRSFLPHAAHGGRVHSKDVLLNLVLPYDIFTSPQGFFVCIQSIYDIGLGVLAEQLCGSYCAPWWAREGAHLHQKVAA